MDKKVITRVEIDEDIIQVRMKNVEKNSLFVGQIFGVLASHDINIDMISSANLEDEMQIDFTCETKDQSKLNQAIQQILENHPRMEVYSCKNTGKLVVEGEDMKDETGVAARVFQILGQAQIPFYQITTSEISISLVIDKKYLKKAQKEIKEGIE